MHLNELGAIVDEEWLLTAKIREHVVVDSLVVMPNHVHAILWIDWKEPDDVSRATHRVAPTSREDSLRPNGPPANSLGAIVGQIKSASTKRINRLRDTPGVPVWQRGFHDRIITSDDILARARAYIERNPSNWTTDAENPTQHAPAAPCRGDAARRPG
jgi:putative transposase